MASNTDMCISRFQNAVRYPLNIRCSEIGRLGEEYSGKELHSIFPVLVEEIFGISNQIGWGLRSIFKGHHLEDYIVVLDFFHPHGTFFKMCYKLMSNNFYLKYDFPISYLPAAVRKMIEDGVVSSIYSDNLKIDPQARVPTALSLNPFEFFMFHFAYHLVNPAIQRTDDTNDIWETAYQKLGEDYIAYFLRCDNSPVPPLVGYYISKSPLPLQTTIRPNRTPTVFRQSVLMQNNTSSSFHSSTISNQQTNRLEIWRSELVAVVFVDFWFATNQATPPIRLQAPLSRERFPPQSGFAANHSLLNSSFSEMKSHSYSKTMQYPQLPSTEHIRIVRSVLKHMHYFSNTYVGDATAMDELKRIYLPSSRVKIYKFLRHTIDQSPLGLDNSFRHILEAWLTFIQPWRYLDYSKYLTQPTPIPRVEDNRMVNQRWLGFIAENLLFYTVVFRQVMHRFARLDLATPKNAAQLHRLTKVFSQPNLCGLLSEIENSLDDTVVSTAPALHKWTAIVRQHILELEGPAYLYIPMFGQQMESEVMRFFNYIREAYRGAQEILENEAKERAKHPPSFWSSLKGIFSSGECDIGNYSLEDRRRVACYLEASVQQMGLIYNMQDIDILPLPMGNRSMFDADTSSSTEYSSFCSPQWPSYQPMSPNGLMRMSPHLTPQAMRERIRRIRYEGDPDLEAIRSTENTFLVRVLYQITSRINEMYSAQMSSCYHRQDLVGRVARRILLPPLLIREFDKRTPGQRSPRVERVLPPRLSLRPLASHRFLAYYLVATMIAFYWGYGPLKFSTILFFVWALMIIVQALLLSFVPESIREGQSANSSN